jgi:alpha-glucosidase (family GH31 glycosyl hydrolase)
MPYGPQAISLDFSFPGDPDFIGLPERALDLSLPNTLYILKGQLYVNEDPLRLFNTDFHDYKIGDSFGLYGSVPLLHSIGSGKPTNKTDLIASVYWANSADTWVDTFSRYSTLTSAGVNVEGET